MADTLSRSLVKAWQAIRQLTATVTKQGEHIASLAAAFKVFGAQSERFGQDLSPLASGFTTIPVTWPNSFPDEAYMVIATVVVPSANLGQCFWQAGAKTTTGCTVVVRNTTASTYAAVLDVLAIRT